MSDQIILNRTCDGCGLALQNGEGKRLPHIPPLDVCSQACLLLVQSAAVGDLPATPTDVVTARAAKESAK